MSSSKTFFAAAVSFKTITLGLRVTLFFITLFAFVFLWGFSQIPSDRQIKSCLTTKMFKVELCPQSSKYTRLGGISQYLQKSVVLTEDSSFWNHNGFDLQEMENSFKKNLEAGKFARGGSTITQQLAKNLFLNRDKTLSRKALEAIITVRIEKTLSKREILERYLNVVQFGKDIFGVKQASHFYFKKSPDDLSLVESAFLTFLLPNPEVYSKSFFKKRLSPFAEKRIRQIMDRLFQYDRITEAEYLQGVAQVDYFLTGQEPPAMDPAIEEISEEDAEELE
jgi:monofunctional biosynthetic peptidoglycan transglycosylase